ncbi:Inositol-1-monophosphatase SuhB [Eumeta japonica]|uniref:Inositol-1-monophosphatase SuhB n=1 Tax=Eumeta variegata TaxID=151549 RepID=A0A4C1SVX2_EUMVA|nr:Inositol-1-monophosphatase SuhB [Eumeta japonica]
MVYSFVVSLLIAFAVKAITGLRVPAAVEDAGIDPVAHGEEAYALTAEELREQREEDASSAPVVTGLGSEYDRSRASDVGPPPSHHSHPGSPSTWRPRSWRCGDAGSTSPEIQRRRRRDGRRSGGRTPAHRGAASRRRSPIEGIRGRRRAIAGAVCNPRAVNSSRPSSGGARLNGAPIRVSAQTELAQALVATGFGYTVERRTEQARIVAELIPRVRDIRRIGAASADLCLLAAGRLDAYYERGLQPWDYAAGALIAREAGAELLGADATTPPGEPYLIAAGGISRRASTRRSGFSADA